MSTSLTAGGRTPASGRVSARGIQIGLGIIWLVDGLLQLQPKMFGTGFANSVILPTTMGQPGFVSGTITHLAHLFAAQPALANSVFAGTQILIGVGLLIRQTVKPALVLSFVWALGVWALGEGFGMLFTGMASPLTGAPGAALLYVAIGVLVWPRTAGPAATGPAAAEGLLGERGGKAVWAIVWSGMGILWLLPANRSGGMISGAISTAVSGEPGWLSHVPLSVAHALGSGGGPVAVACAALSVAIGLGPLLTRPSFFLVAGAALALDYWVFGEGFGGVFTGLGTDPNTGPLLVLLALAVYPNRAPARSLATASSRAGGGMTTPSGAMAA